MNLSPLFIGWRDFLIFISCMSNRDFNVSFVFPSISNNVPITLSLIFFSMYITSKLYLNNKVLQYGSSKNILFFFQLSRLSISHFLFLVLPPTDPCEEVLSCTSKSSPLKAHGATLSSFMLSKKLLFRRYG